MPFAHNRSTNLKKKLESHKTNFVNHRNKAIADCYQKRFLNKLSFWTNRDAKNNGTLTLPESHLPHSSTSQSSENEFEDGDVEDNDIINDYEADFDQMKPNNGHLDDQNEYFFDNDQNNSSLTIESYIFKNNNAEADNSILNDDSELNLSKKISSLNTLKLNKSFKDLLVRVSSFRTPSRNVYEDREEFEEETDIPKAPVIANAEFSQDLKAKEKVLAYVDEAINDVWGRIYDSSTFVEEEIMTLYEQNVPSYISFDHAQMNKNHTRNNSTCSSNASTNSNYTFGMMENNADLNSPFPDFNARRRSTLVSMNQNKSPLLHDAFAQKWKSLEVELKDTKTKMEGSMTSKNHDDIKMFWGLWDSIKTHCVQLLEVDEDECSDILPETQLKTVINDLEHSRVYYN